EVDSNEEMIQIYKMIPTYRWSECEVDSINFNKISNYSISLIPMQSSVKISLLSSDAEYGKSFVRKIVDIAHCVYGKSKKNEIEYFKKIENATRAKIDTNKKFLDAVDVIYLNEYLMGIKELHNLKDIKVYLNSQSSQQLSFKTSLHSERMLSYVLIVLLFFLCEFLILLPRIFFCP
ncbi:hypothetical protein, partial [Mesorhizobium japonicum]|uniref:hypothetical protein n=1 Tax=Mesorhizobium japonicum TaxID=2066070 RepID=UPI003B594116